MFSSKFFAPVVCICGIQDVLSEFDNEEIDRAIALSLSEEEQRKAKAVGSYDIYYLIKLLAYLPLISCA